MHAPPYMCLHDAHTASREGIAKISQKLDHSHAIQEIHGFHGFFLFIFHIHTHFIFMDFSKRYMDEQSALGKCHLEGCHIEHRHLGWDAGSIEGACTGAQGGRSSRPQSQAWPGVGPVILCCAMRLRWCRCQRDVVCQQVVAVHPQQVLHTVTASEVYCTCALSLRPA